MVILVLTGALSALLNDVALLFQRFCSHTEVICWELLSAACGTAHSLLTSQLAVVKKWLKS